MPPRHLRQRRAADVDLRDAIQRIALQFPAYGRPRITAELKRQGWQVNHKRVGRILREDNLLCLRKRKFQITTDSRHGFRVYPNLTRKFVPAARNQLWVADITYIRLADEFVYLAVVLDAYSRMVIGWAVERTLEAKDARSPNKDQLEHLKGHIALDVAELLPVLRQRAEGLAAKAKQALTARGDREAKEMVELLKLQRARIQDTLTRGMPTQLTLDFGAEEKRQLEGERKHQQKRLADLEKELEAEPARIRRSYEVHATRIEPVGVVYLWPVTG